MRSKKILTFREPANKSLCSSSTLKNLKKWFRCAHPWVYDDLYVPISEHECNRLCCG